MSDWLDTYAASLSPAGRRNFARRRQVIRARQSLARRCPWMRWPVLCVVYTFWACLMEEGVVATCRPHWGALTFAYLNDGDRPTLYHTLRSIIDPSTPYYPQGAPRNRAEAES